MPPVPVFFSRPTPHREAQRAFIEAMVNSLRAVQLAPSTLGADEFDDSVPLAAVRRLMMESNGVVVLALRRYWSDSFVENPGADLDERSERRHQKTWMTSPWAHIEGAMGYQLGLPLLIVRERGVHTDGILEKGNLAKFVPEADIEGAGAEFFESVQWRGILDSWRQRVLEVRKFKGLPDLLRRGVYS